MVHDETFPETHCVHKMWYLYWWTISAPGYYPPSSQCYGTDMLYYIYLLLQLSFLNNIIINNIKKNKVLLNEA
jgi:hypothetical protein